MRKSPISFILVSALLLGVFTGQTLTHPTEGIIGQDLIVSDPSKVTDEPTSGTFIINAGQWDPTFLYVAGTDFGHVALSQDAIYYHVLDRAEASKSMRTSVGITALKNKPILSLSGSVIKLNFDGANPTLPKGSDRMDSNTNFFVGNDPSRWAGSVPSYDRVEYPNIWDGIDIIFRIEDASLKYDIVLGPGADPDDIEFRLEGVSEVNIRDDTLFLLTPTGHEIRDSGLVASYLDGAGERIEIEFVSNRINSYGFRLGVYDRTRPVLIDPLVYSTYYGGSNDEIVFDMVIDPNGNCFVTGYTFSTNFPVTPGAYQMTNAAWLDVFVFKLNADATSRVYSTYVGGDDFDIGTGIAIDASGYAYVTGFTYSTDFPTTGDAYNKTHWNTIDYVDTFVFKLNPSGSDLVFSTYVAGEWDDFALDICIDNDGNSYVLGASDSDNFPTTSGAYQETHGGYMDIILFKLSSTGSDLLYSTFMGGSSDDIGYSLYLHNPDTAYFTGSTFSWDFPTTTGASYVDWFDVIAVKMDIGNSTLYYSHMFGGDDEEEGYDISVDSIGNAYICGFTWGGSRTMFPTTQGAYSETFNGGDTDMFVTKLDPSGSKLVYSTYIGGSGDEAATSISIDRSGNAYICGWTRSTDFPTTSNSEYPNYRGGDSDAVVLKLDNAGANILYSTFLGGNQDESANALHLGSNAEAVVAGETDSTNFPTTSGVLYTRNQGGYDCFIARLNFSTPPSPPQTLSVEGGIGHIQLSWSPPLSDGGSPMTHYTIYRGYPAGALTKLTEVDDPEFNDTKVNVGYTYYYAVSANNSIGESERTLPISSMAISIPAPPLNLVGVAGIDNIALDWAPPLFDGGLAITGYRIYRGNVSGSPSLLAQVGSSPTEYSDTAVELGKKYYYSLSALNAVGESPRSSEIEVIMPDVPSPPRNLSVRSGDGFVQLNWLGPQFLGGLSLNGFRIYRGAFGEELTLHWSLTDKVISYNDTSVINGVTYVYNVTAITDAGESDPAQITATPLSVPGVPTLLAPCSGDGFVHLGWESPANNGGAEIISYRVYHINDTGVQHLLTEVGNNVFEFNHTDLINGKEYTYVLTCTNQVGESMKSPKVSTTPLGLPDVPTNILAHAGSGFVFLSWAPPSDNGGSPIIQYTIMRRTDTDYILIANTSLPFLNDTSVINGMPYFYKVCSVTAVGSSDFSADLMAIPRGLPSAPWNLTVSARDKEVFLVWNAPVDDGGSSLLGFKIFRGESDSVQEELVTLDPAITNYTDDDVTNGIVYYYYIIAFNSVGVSPQTDLVSVQPLGLPTPPENVQVAQVEEGLLVTWQIPYETGGVPITGYDILRSDNGDEFKLIGSVGADATSYLDKDVKVGVKYQYKVRAKTTAGSTYSSATAELEFEQEQTGGNLGLVVGIVIASLVIVLALVLGIFLVLRRKKPEPEQPPITEEEIVTPEAYPLQEDQQQTYAPLPQTSIQSDREEDTYPVLNTDAEETPKIEGPVSTTIDNDTPSP